MVLDSTVRRKKENDVFYFFILLHGLRGFMNIHKSHGSTSHCTPMSPDIPHTACKSIKVNTIIYYYKFQCHV